MRIVDEIYKKVYDAVVEEIELPDSWMRSKMEDCVDARSILIHYLSKMGLSRTQIEVKTGLSKTAVRQHANSYASRIKTRRMMLSWDTHIGRNLGAGADKAAV